MKLLVDRVVSDQQGDNFSLYINKMSEAVPISSVATSKLLEAIKKNNEGEVRKAIEEGAIINGEKKEGDPLYEAVLYARPNIVKILINAGADPSRTDTRGNNYLYEFIMLAMTHSIHPDTEKQMLDVLVDGNEQTMYQKNKRGISPYSLAYRTDQIFESYLGEDIREKHKAYKNAQMNAAKDIMPAYGLGKHIGELAGFRGELHATGGARKRKYNKKARKSRSTKKGGLRGRRPTRQRRRTRRHTSSFRCKGKRDGVSGCRTCCTRRHKRTYKRCVSRCMRK